MKNRKLKDTLRNNFSHKQIQLLVRGFDVIGDVGIIIIPDELLAEKEEIGAAVLQSVPHIRLVARRVGHYSGEYRTIALEKISGRGDFETIHKEFAIRLHVNPEKVYFSPRSAAERYRVAQSVSTGERVLVMFSGIAPLPLMIARHSNAREIVGVEKNPIAHHYGLKNIAANKKLKNLHLVCGDVAEIVPDLVGKFDRIAMPLPLSASEYVQVAFDSLKSYGALHFYDFEKEDSFSAAIAALEIKCGEMGRELYEAAVIKCGHIGPGKYRICIDARIR